jgi:precorrin-6Y C5,15-methyltransferase (decarboxylating)
MPDCLAYVCERLGERAERIHAARLFELPGRCFDPLNVLVLLPGQGTIAQRAFGRSEDAYDSVRGQITKAEVRAVTLAKLEPWRASLVWDIGAGSGSVSIETAGLMSSGAIYAVERDAEQLESLYTNLRRHHAGLVHVVAGSAPQALEGLPAPDAVFIGGAGGALDAILRLAAERLSPGGRLVANFTLLESLNCWQSVADSLGWPSEICQLSAARGQPLGTGTHLVPVAPVFVTRLLRPEEPR